MRNGKVALVTGSSTGIGAAVAKQLARDGFDIAVHYNSSREEGEKVLEAVRAEGVNGCLLHGNTAEVDVPDRLIAECVEQLGRLDVLVNNAGITRFEELRDIKPETMDSLYNLDFRGMILCAKAAANYMVENGVQGVILFNTSIRSFSPHTSDAVYAGLKAGLNRAIESLRSTSARTASASTAFRPVSSTCARRRTRIRGTASGTATTGAISRCAASGVRSIWAMWCRCLSPIRRRTLRARSSRADGGLSILGAPDNMGDIFRIFDIKELCRQLQ